MIGCDEFCRLAAGLETLCDTNEMLSSTMKKLSPETNFILMNEGALGALERAIALLVVRGKPTEKKIGAVKDWLDYYMFECAFGLMPDKYVEFSDGTRLDIRSWKDIYSAITYR